jgi:hypothetical protein
VTGGTVGRTVFGMNTATISTRTPNRPFGTVACLSLVLGPALLSLALATLPNPWNGSVPNYDTVNSRHGLLMLSFNLAAAAFPFLFGSVVALALVARRSPRLASAGLVCSLLGLSAMFGNAMLSMPIVLMNGIDDHTALNQLAGRLGSPPLIALYTFPLFVLGSLLLAAALWRSRAVPAWSAVCVGIGGLIPLAILTGIGAVALLIAAVRIAGSVPAAKTLLAKST